MKTYYFANSGCDLFGGYDPICIDLAEVERLAREWDMTTEELLDQMHEASLDEIEEYGVYDS
jgi:2-iminoacetate synthase ThiH